jgi:hypothetical protein
MPLHFDIAHIIGHIMGDVGKKTDFTVESGDDLPQSALGGAHTVIIGFIYFALFGGALAAILDVGISERCGGAL